MKYLHSARTNSIIIFFLILGCATDNKTGTSINQVSLAITDTVLKIPIDTLTFPQSGCSYYFSSKNGANFLTYLNKKFNEIHFYCLDSKKLAFKVRTDIDGPNGIGSKIRGFWVHNLDSIYVTPKARKIILVLNRKGEVIDKIDYNNYDFMEDSRNKLNKMMSFYSRPNMPLIILNNSLFISMFPAGNWNEISQEEVNDIDLTFQLRTDQNSIKSLNLNYPISTFKKNNFEFSRIYGNNNFVYSFNADHNIYVSNNHKEYRLHPAKSQYFDHFESYPRNGSSQDYFMKRVTNPAYLRILYDPYRDAYYRIAYPGYEVQKNDNLRELIKYIPRFSIIILDSNFSKIGEVMMPMNTFDVSDVFVNEEGLYISENHIMNKSFNPDFLSFRLLKFIKNEN